MPKQLPLNFSDFEGLKMADVVGLVYGYKALVSAGHSDKLERALRRVLPKYGLHCAALGSRYDYRRKGRTLLLASETSTLEQAAEAYKEQDFAAIGELLGYPGCCVKRYCENLPDAEDDFVRRCAVNSSDFLWPLNNLLNFDGRLKAGKTPKLLQRELAFISHNPCAYDCPKSLRLAELNCRLILRHLNRPWQKDHFSRLADPVLYVDDLNFASLRGTSRGTAAEFSGIGFVVGLERLRPKLAAADGLTVEEGRVVLVKAGKMIHEASFRKAPLLLPFDRSAA